MKIENLTCIDYQKSGETLIVIVKAKTMEEAEKELIGKDILTLSTDNEETPEVVEKFLGYIKGRNIQKDLSRGVFTVTLCQITDQERELKELRERVEALERKDDTAPATLSVEAATVTKVSTKTAKQVNLTN